jgi:two-component system OmpR family response regulator
VNFTRRLTHPTSDIIVFMDADPADIGESRQISARVLLADDSQNERSALAQYLRRMGYEVSEASDGQATIEHLKSHEVDALLLDLNMPSVDGFDVLGYLQKHRRALPVVLLSGMPLDQIQQHIHGLPSRELPPLMLKPIDVDQLLEVLELQMRGDLNRAVQEEQGRTQQTN